MKVLDLHCRQGHVFEGWFASEEDFQRQLRDALVQCPLCADSQISKRLSAPRLNLGARQTTAEPAAPVTDGAAASSPAEVSGVNLQAAWLSLARKVLAATEDVGPQFAQEARRIHHGQAEERAIRGQASPDEAMQLLDEGIAVLPLLLPQAAKETLQ
ncbi:DUF1178 family protein [Acidovorax sp. JHL-9]|uniref:DUF1178 family protein n=1 Tax=Acidovorax sp. JHL-9 TaxID=1276756 RepID=UPI0004036C96|nr:DUF1178 family protein [Acidovorax sp. JHL-9]